MFSYFFTSIVTALLLSACMPTGDAQNTNLRGKTTNTPSQQDSEDIAPASGLKPLEEANDHTKKNEPEESVDITEIDNSMEEDRYEDDEVVVTSPSSLPEILHEESFPKHEPTPELVVTKPTEELAPDAAPIPTSNPTPISTPDPTPAPISIPDPTPVSQENDRAEEILIEEAPGTVKLDENKKLLAEFSRFTPRFRLTLEGNDQAQFFSREKGEITLSANKDSLLFPKRENLLHFKKIEAEKINDDYTIIAVVQAKNVAADETIARLLLTTQSVAEEKKGKKEKKEKEKEPKGSEKEKKEKDDKKNQKLIIDDAKEKKAEKKHTLNIELFVHKLQPIVRIAEKHGGKNKKPIVLKPKFKLDAKKWHLLTLSIVDNHIHIYSGDKLLAKEKISFSNFDYNRTELWIGARNKNGKGLWSGDIADINLYDGVPAIFRGE